MSKVRNMPAPWKRTGPSGFYSIPFGEGEMLFSPSSQVWLYNVRRGKSPFDDRWGPWRGSFGDLDRISKEMVAWEETLRGVGWFSMKLSKQAVSGKSFTEADQGVRNRLVSRLPRCSVIPFYLLIAADRALAGKGKARKSRTLRVGGIDVVDDTKGDWWAPIARSSVDLSIRSPGEKRFSPSTHHLPLDLVSMDALLSFLLDVRERLIDKEAEQSVRAHMMSAGKGDDIRARFQSTVEASQEISSLFTLLKSASTEQVATIRAMSEMIMAGEMEVEFLYEETATQQPGSAQIH